VRIDELLTQLALPETAATLSRLTGYPPAGAEVLRLRLTGLVEEFRRQFPSAPELSIARAPGRVNLLGEHTDYNGYPVLPMAIDRDILLAFAPLEDRAVEIASTAPAHGGRRFPLQIPLSPYAGGDWGNYVKAAVSGLLGEARDQAGPLRGFRGLYDGTIPEAAGLSSSSALVVVTALALQSTLGISITPMALAGLLAHAEHYVGSEGGGMDQAVSLLSQPGKALRIDFRPLRTRPVAIPSGFAVMVCDSLTPVRKSAEARTAYNTRVAECRMAVALLRRALATRLPREAAPELLQDFEAYGTDVTADERDAVARLALGPRPLSRRELGMRLGLRPEEVAERFCTPKEGSLLPVPRGGFPVWRRYRHVVSEARRVEEAVTVLEHGDVRRFAQLLNDSHTSCARDFDISSPELDALVEVARRHGALGARLTGAGFGGCTLSLVPEAAVETFIEGIRRDYYEAVKGVSESQAVFRCHPVGAAGILFE
jgi:N-acetylgalactosamine kinase